jgi:hypothetical protein
MRCARGQASVEWIVVVALVAAVFLAALVAGVPGTDAIPRGVEAAFARAFCLVSGGDCLSGPPQPCVVRSLERSRERRASFSVVRLADGRTVLREERSDGTVAVSVEDGARLGARMTWGGHFRVSGRGVEAGAALGADGRAGRGRRFVLRDAAAADALIARLDEESRGVRSLVGGGRIVAEEQWWEVGRDGRAEAAVKAVALGAGTSLRRSAVVGVRSRRSGERTFVLRMDSQLIGELTAGLWVELGLLEAGLGGSTAVELAVDAHGRPSSFVVHTARGVHAAAELGPFRSGGGDLVEAEVRLDLADPVLRAEVAALLGAVGDVAPGRAVAAARSVGARLVDRARVDLRLYDTDRRSSVRGVSAGLLGVGGGYEVEEVTQSARLVDAAGREPGLGWARRLDCVGIA